MVEKMKGCWQQTNEQRASESGTASNIHSPPPCRSTAVENETKCIIVNLVNGWIVINRVKIFPGSLACF